MTYLFIVGAVVLAIGSGIASTKYPHVDRRFKTGYKNNAVPEPGDPRGLWLVLAGVVLLIAPCVSIYRFFQDPPPPPPPPKAPTVIADMAAPTDLANSRHKRRRLKKSADSYELMPDTPSAAPAAPANRDTDDE